MDEQQPKPERRKRYTGTHPKAFKEKYKELQPEQYAADAEKIIQQGRTPAGTHRSIMVKEILDCLKILPGQTGLDATLGYGGHSLEMLKCVLPGGRLFATDVDGIELQRTKERLLALGYDTDVLVIKKMNFSGIDQVVYESGLLDFVLADLGVSSMQIDNPERGFSYKHEGPLDLRLNSKTGKSAAQYLQTVSAEELEEVLANNSDEPYAAEIATHIVAKIKRGGKINTTMQLKECISEALQFISESKRKDEIKRSAPRCFQAIRIAINDEFLVLEKFLDKLPAALTSGGRVAILTFHSGEDRRVKKSFQNLFREGIYSQISEEVIRPSVEECATNSRASSAKLRWAVRA
ncbi:MAG: 16S rRNA (cytosine(1402)-N(4))-methyltransferase RsmH [Bacteroidia bacterium]|nr:16S rRNA (cytosine(1402)-N(4))-methyltransferase RsmH [Bacteroidia bacterium]